MGQCPFSRLSSSVSGSLSGFSRRQFVTTALSSLAATAVAYAGGEKLARAAGDALPSNAQAPGAAGDLASTSSNSTAIEPFYGPNQGGITTPTQQHSYFAAFDLTTANRADVISLLQKWTQASARMTQGQTAEPLPDDLTQRPTDSGDALGLSPERLTLTFGFGAGLFSLNGQDRYGLASRRPAALVDLPTFNGDQLVAERTGGDLSVQACSDDPLIAFHAVRQLSQIALTLGGGVAKMRWAQTGFQPQAKGAETSRNLMGFKDGTMQPKTTDNAVWVGSEGPDWMQGGSYVVVRRIRIALEHWDRTPVSFQQKVVGRCKYSGAPLGQENENDPIDLNAVDADGNPVIPANSHVRLAAPASNGGAELLRRGYSYNDGANFTTERWPPWRQGVEYDAGLFFVAYQKDPRTAFIPVFTNMAKLDMMNQYTTHNGSGLFACPGGTLEGEYIGQKLFQ
jgi:deferrochelatase/peroxidase EfeB